jgi:aminopeptidase N
MASTSCQGTEAFHPVDNIITRIYSAGSVNQLVAHEISHQYWGQAVKMWSPEDQWLSESFAEYCSLLTVMNMKNKGKDEYDHTVDEWFRMSDLATKISSIPLANALAPEDDNYEEQRYRPYLIYFKGACLLYRIHKDLGDADFIRLLRSYIKTFNGQHSTTAHVPMIIKALTGKDYTKFMEDYYWGLAMPPRKP